MALANIYKIEPFDPEILREYDIRGIVGNNLTVNTAYTIGRTFGHVVFLQSVTRNIVVVVIIIRMVFFLCFDREHSSLRIVYKVVY